MESDCDDLSLTKKIKTDRISNKQIQIADKMFTKLYKEGSELPS